MQQRALDRFLKQDPWDLAAAYMVFFGFENGWTLGVLVDMPVAALIQYTFGADEVISARKKQAAEAASK